jgi:lipopolysaccharide/colanic/teichoic acid biosynthesis glycosyltransferase
MKRALDVAVALLLLLMLPLALLVCVAIKVTNGGPIFFSQPRVGADGRVFRIWKFRSMSMDVPGCACDAGAQPHAACARRCTDGADPRVTPVGRLLRHSSLDEYPQLLNVLVGQMSMVGPRPHVPWEVAEYSPLQKRRLEVLPGLTGLAQVEGRKDLSVDEMVALDLDYIERWSLWLDLKILVRTVPAVVCGRGAC